MLSISCIDQELRALLVFILSFLDVEFVEGDKGVLSSCTFKVQSEWELFPLLFLSLSNLDVEDNEDALEVDKVTLAIFEVDDGDNGALSLSTVKILREWELIASLFLSLLFLDVEDDDVVFEVGKVNSASFDRDNVCPVVNDGAISPSAVKVH